MQCEHGVGGWRGKRIEKTPSFSNVTAGAVLKKDERVQRMIAMSPKDDFVFTKEHFLDGVNGYPWHGGPYSSLFAMPPPSVLAHRARQVVSVLRNWGGLRTSNAGLTDSHAAEIIEAFLGTRQSELQDLDRARLEDLTPDQTTKLGELLGDLRTRGSRPHLPLVGAGKLLHFLLPTSAMIWDNIYVRAPLLLTEDFSSEGDQYMALLRFGRRLLDHVRLHAGQGALEEVRTEHMSATGCRGSLPKLIDELFYDKRGNRERAILALGGLGPALALG